MKIEVVTLVAALTMLLGACATVGSEGSNASRRAIIQSKTGCPEAKVLLSEQESDTWTANCGDKKFYCSRLPTKDGEEQTCTEALE